MGAIKLRGYIKEGMLTAVVPQDLKEGEVDVTIETASTLDANPDKEDWANLPGNERVKILMQFAGTAKYPNVETHKYDVYDQ